MTPAARVAAAIEVLDSWREGTAVEPAFLAWSRRSRFAGSKDRAAIRDLVFDALRRFRSYSALGGAETGRGVMIGALRAAGRDPREVFSGERFAPPPLTGEESTAGRTPEGAVALDLPDWLAERLEAMQTEDWRETAEALRTRAPVHLRANLSRIDRAALVERLGTEQVTAEPHPEVATALEVTEGERRLRNAPAMAEGLAELQDAMSQEVVLRLTDPAPRRVLDYCAGGGGKALAFADLTGAEVVAHDIDPRRMSDLPARAARAGVSVTCASPGGIRGAFDLVFCDAPCSGSGSWRRDPQGKWRLTPERLAELGEMQDAVLEAALPHVAPGGRLAYATCSVLPEENEARVAGFTARHPGWQVVDGFRSRPGPQGDGFFLSVLKATSPEGS